MTSLDVFFDMISWFPRCEFTSQVSVKYQQNEKHFNYTTPKSFLEFMKLYDNLLRKKRTELTQKMERLENGLQKLQTTASQVRGKKHHIAPVYTKVYVSFSYFFFSLGGGPQSQVSSAGGRAVAEKHRYRSPHC